MRYLDGFRSLHTYVTLRLFLPFALLLAGVLAVGIAIYLNSVTQLVLERHQQLANLAAVTISQGIEGNARVLEALRTRTAPPPSPDDSNGFIFHQSAEALGSFNIGVVQVDRSGGVVAIAPNTNLDDWQTIPEEVLRQLAQDPTAPVFSGVVTTHAGADFILIAVPVEYEDKQFAGAIIGGVDLNDPANFISNAIQRLTLSTPGIAYLVDKQGKVISHPEAGEIGSDYTDQPYIGQAVHGKKGGSIWNDPKGQRFVGAEAIVNPSGWSLIIKEPWDAITAPIRRYTLLIIGFMVLALIVFFFLSWSGTQQVTAPIQKLSKSTSALARGEAIPPMEVSRILEIDNLRASFMQTANQIASYRDGLRHYVDAMTRSQEDERLRIARELHDETVQNLLAIYRRMELFTATETDENKKQQLDLLHNMLHQTLQGVRRISQDLRPMMLDDLGFIPAVQMLVHAAHEGMGGVPGVDLDVRGDIRPLSPALELALYRIVQEALSNVRKHARATRLQVIIEYQAERIYLEIADDGVGFVVPASFTELVQAGNLGLMGIQERVWAIGGALNVDSHPDKGTMLSVSLNECQNSSIIKDG